MSEFEYLPPPKRAKRYRALAEDARREAANAKGALRESYLLSAEKWEKLAADLERDVAGDDSEPGSKP
jgi:hypothetical protein